MFKSSLWQQHVQSQQAVDSRCSNEQRCPWSLIHARGVKQVVIVPNVGVILL